jgi:hypothetical protein
MTSATSSARSRMHQSTVDRGKSLERGTYDLGDLFPSEGVRSLKFMPLLMSGAPANSELLALGVEFI